MKTKMLAKLFGLGVGMLLVANSAYAEGDIAAGKIKFASCIGCHGLPGYANVYPRYNVPKLGGQHADYIVSSLKAYASGERKHASMQGNARGLQAQDIEDIAVYLNQLEFVVNEITITGDPDVGKEKATACGGCHGADGNSLVPGYPRLAGQYESYLVKALKQYKDGGRNNPIMSGMVAALSEDDFVDIAAYYAVQTHGLRIIE